MNSLIKLEIKNDYIFYLSNLSDSTSILVLISFMSATVSQSETILFYSSDSLSPNTPKLFFTW